MSWNIDAPNLSGDPAVTGYTELAPGESKTVTERIFVRQKIVYNKALTLYLSSYTGLTVKKDIHIPVADLFSRRYLMNRKSGEFRTVT